MKTLKTLLSVLAMVAVFSASAFAQTSGNASVNASATIVGSITATNVADLAFGQILDSETPTIAATDADAGYISVTGATTGQTINVSISFPNELTGPGTEVLDFGSYSAAVSNSGDDDPTNAGALTGENLTGQTLTGSYSATGSTGYLFVGGQITSATAGIAGDTYDADITITVDYN